MSLGASSLRVLAAFGAGGLSGVAATDLYSRKNPHPEVLKYGPPTPLAPGVQCRANHCLQYDPQRRTPLWVAEHINRRKVQQPEETAANRRNSKFLPDPRLSPEVRAANEDYWNSGWTRGHLAPAGNNKHCQRSMDDTFLLSNIVPQDYDHNGDFWNRLEGYCRDLTKEFDDVRVISGPLWLPSERRRKEEEIEVVEVAAAVDDPNDERNVSRKLRRLRRNNRVIRHEVIGENGVFVPTHLYKVVLAERGNTEKLMSAFVVPNEPISKDKTLKDFQVSLSQLEGRLGFKLHAELNRDGVRDLCEVHGCKMAGQREYQRKYLLRGVQRARDEEDLERKVSKVKSLDMYDPEFDDAYAARKSRLEKKKKDKEEKMEQAKAAVAGG